MVHRLDLRIRLQPIRTQLPPDPTLLEPAERRLHMQQRVRVDPDCSGLERTRDAHGLLGVIGEDGGGEAVGGVVCEVDRFFFRLEFRDDDDGAKDLRHLHELVTGNSKNFKAHLFLDTLHIRLDVGDHRRRDVEPFRLIPLAAASRNRRAVLLGVFNVSEDLVPLPGRDERAERGRFVRGLEKDQPRVEERRPGSSPFQ